MDSIFVDNLGMQPVDCVRISASQNTHGKPIHSSSHTHGAFGHNSHHSHSQSARAIRSKPPGCVNFLQLDQGYRLYYLDIVDASGASQNPFIAFVSVHEFPKPEWAQNEDEEHLEIHWRPFRLPKRFNTNYAYAKLTNWYSYHFLNLRLLDFFDYAGKIDNDVSFMKDFPEPNLPKRMANGNHFIISTQPEWYSDMPAVANGVKFCLENFMENETKECKRDHTKREESLHAAGHLDSTFWERPEVTFRSHFMTFWLGLYTAPEVKLLARHWNDFHPHGMWDYRWGDQQWWPRPIHLFTNSSINVTIDKYIQIDTDNADSSVRHKEYPRMWTVSKCVYLNISHPVSAAQREDCYKAEAAKLPA
eukprot:GSChrysophyteH1.ASY1.ANO1.1178.1 assembled CDS